MTNVPGLYSKKKVRMCSPCLYLAFPKYILFPGNLAEISPFPSRLTNFVQMWLYTQSRFVRVHHRMVPVVKQSSRGGRSIHQLKNACSSFIMDAVPQQIIFPTKLIVSYNAVTPAHVYCLNKWDLALRIKSTGGLIQLKENVKNSSMEAVVATRIAIEPELNAKLFASHWCWAGKDRSLRLKVSFTVHISQLTTTMMNGCIEDHKNL